MIKSFSRRQAGIWGAALLLFPLHASAQVPSSVQPGQVIRQFDARPQPKAQREDIVGLPEDETVRIAPGGPAFVLRGIVLDGGTVYAPADIEKAAAGYIDTEVDFSALQEIKRKLTVMYRADGYILSRAELYEGATVRGGVVHFTAVEGFASDVLFEGDTGGLEAFLHDAAVRIKQSKPLNIRDAESALLLVEDLPGVTVQSVFGPSPDTQNASLIRALVRRDRVDGLAAIDNRGSRFLGPLQASLRAALNYGMHRTQARGISTTPGDELRFFDLTQESFIGGHGLKAMLRFASSNSEAGGSVANLGISGDSRLLEGELSYPFLRARRLNLAGYLGGQGVNTSSDLLGLPSTEDRVRGLRMGVLADYADGFGGVTAANFQARRGIDAFGATDEGPGRSRANGRQDFTAFHLSASRAQDLPGLFSVFMAVEGQYARHALLASEEFAVGGAVFGRGYDAAEITGDSGFAGSLELRYGDVLPVRWPATYQLYGFYDGGKVWNRDRVVLETEEESLASTGGGVRFGLPRDIEAQAELAIPLTRPVVAEGGDEKGRVFFRLSKGF